VLSKERHLNLRVFFREKRPGVWLAQGVDHDISAQGTTLEHAKHTFALSLLGQVMLDIEAGREPLAGLGPPPAESLEGFERGWPLATRELTLPPGMLAEPWVVRADLGESRVYSA
jgi:hypothetical protein